MGGATRIGRLPRGSHRQAAREIVAWDIGSGEAARPDAMPAMGASRLKAAQASSVRFPKPSSDRPVPVRPAPLGEVEHSQHLPQGGGPGSARAGEGVTVGTGRPGHRTFVAAIGRKQPTAHACSAFASKSRPTRTRLMALPVAARPRCPAPCPARDARSGSTPGSSKSAGPRAISRRQGRTAPPSLRRQSGGSTRSWRSARRCAPTRRRLVRAAGPTVRQSTATRRRRRQTRKPASRPLPATSASPAAPLITRAPVVERVPAETGRFGIGGMIPGRQPAHRCD